MSAPVVEPVRDDDDLAAWAAVHNRVAPTALSADEVRAYREAFVREIHLLARGRDEIVGAAFAGLESASGVGGVAGWVGVVPEARRGGVGSALLAVLSDWARQTGLGALEGYVAEDDAESLAWAARRGFAEVGRDSWLALDLRPLEPAAADPPAGVAIVTLAAHPELLRGVYEVASEAYPDIPGHEGDEMEVFEDWVAQDMSGPNDDPEGIFLALAGSEVVGYSKFHLPRARPGVAMHDVTGVRRAWRGRGIAGALKRAQIAWAKERGYERLETWNETRNAPIRKLNKRLGYRLAPGRVLVRGPSSIPAETSYSPE